MYKCPVCNERLTKLNNTYKCLKGHSFDINKKGFVNLLLANQGHSSNPGDSKEMVDARTNFLNKGYYEELRELLCKLIDKYIPNTGVFCDLACGEGYYTHKIHKYLNTNKDITSYGVDLSKFAIAEATRKMRVENIKNLNYSIGNLMYLPYLDKSIDLALNCFAPFFEDEFARIIKEKGYFIRVLPNEKHMFELKEILYKEVKLNTRKETSLSKFILIHEEELVYKKEFNDSEDLLSLFKMTPLYYKSNLDVLEKIKKINKLNLTLGFTVLVYERV